MEASHKKQRPHIKVGKDAEEEVKFHITHIFMIKLVAIIPVVNWSVEQFLLDIRHKLPVIIILD